MSDSVVAYIFNESPIVEAELRSIEKKKNGVVKMVAVLQEAELQNRNKRIYPKKVMDAALEAPYIKEKLRTNSLLGESSHPIDPSVQRQSTVMTDNASHVVKKIYWDKDDPNILLGEVETAFTITGRNFAGLITENNMQASFSMRGLGDVEKLPSGIMRVKNPLKIITWDSVHFPSHEKAYMRNLINENTTMHEVRISELARYAASNSKDLQQLNESFLEIAADKIEYRVNEKGILTIVEKVNRKPVASLLLETNLRNEVTSAFRRLF